MIATAHELKGRNPTFCDYLASRKIPALLFNDTVKREPIQGFLGAVKCFVIGERYFHKVDRVQGIPKGRIVIKAKGVEIRTQSSRDLNKIVMKTDRKNINKLCPTQELKRISTVDGVQSELGDLLDLGV